jgi:flavin-dependent dehydrogenase
MLYEHWKPEEVAYAIESEVPVGERGVQNFVGTSAYFDVYFNVSPAGYGWVFPKDDHLTVGVGCRLSNLRDAQGLFQGFVKRLSELEGQDIPKPKAHLIPLGGIAKVRSVTDRVLLAGDSAGFAEPLLGEGIYFAILGAQIAAQTAAQACQEERFDGEFLQTYPDRCRDAFQEDFDMAYRMAKAAYLERNDMDRVARLFFSNKKFQAFMVGVMLGSVRYRDARLKLAWPYLKYNLSRLGSPS